MITAMPNFITAQVEAAASFYSNHLGYVEILRVPDESPEHIVLRLGTSVLAVSSPDALREAGLDPQPNPRRSPTLARPPTPTSFEIHVGHSDGAPRASPRRTL